ncbi:MAG: hypothetical protein Q7S23_06210 [bacterium]|nr:hypothetical protein [bacterium]
MSVFRNYDERPRGLELALIVSVVAAAVAFELFVRGIRFFLRRKP